MEVSLIVHNARSASALTYRELARDAGVAASTVTRIQSGRIEPTVEVLSRILDACGYDLQLRAVPKSSTRGPRLDDLVDAWTPNDGGALQLDWTRWRAWLDLLARQPDLIPEAIYLPPLPSGHRVVDALLAAVAEKLADDAGLRRPSWTGAITALTEQFEPPARRRGEIPEQFARRGLIIGSESLFRPKATVGV